VTAGAFGHPAFLKEHHFRNLQSMIPYKLLESQTLLISPDSEPLFLSCTDIDHTFTTEGRREALDILRAEKKKYQLQLFTGVEHGFALRGNMDEPHERELQNIRSVPVAQDSANGIRICERAEFEGYCCMVRFVDFAVNRQ